MHRTTDAVIIGGGPAGLAAAIALRSQDIDCLLLEALQPSIDKACGEGLMPDAIDSLRQLGIQITEEDGYPFRGIRFVNVSHQTSSYFPRGMGIGVRRTRLHQRMIERAQEVGATLLWGCRPKLEQHGAISIDGAPINYRWLVGADGQASALRRWAGFERVVKESTRFGLRRHYNVAPWSEYVEIYWALAGQAYVTPIASGTLCVMLVTKTPIADRENAISAFPELARKLKNATISSRERGGVSATRKLGCVANDSIALVGDASGSVDAITGEGLAISFRQAIALAEAAARNDLASYGSAHREIVKLPHAMARLMLTMDRWPAVQRSAMEALSDEPALFRHLLAVHVGSENLYRFALRRGARLGWRMLHSFGRAF